MRNANTDNNCSNGSAESAVDRHKRHHVVMMSNKQTKKKKRWGASR
jgi:hypothetical protein